MVKKLQKNSTYAQYDLDNDGTVSDEELIQMKEIKTVTSDVDENF